MSIPNPQLIASNVNQFDLNNTTISVKINSNSYNDLSPKLYLEFDNQFKLKYYENSFLKNFSLQIFKYIYLCGDGIQYQSNRNSIKIVNTTGANRYQNKQIHLREGLTNPIVFLHEILHAIYDTKINLPEYHNHNIEHNLCSKRDLYTNGAPGLMLDVVNRLEMHFTPTKLGSVQHAVHYFGDQLYESLKNICSSNLKHSPEFPSNKLKNLTTPERENIKPKELLDERKFLHLKFGDEFNVLSKIKGFPDFLSKKEYIKLNLENYYDKLKPKNCTLK